VVRIARALRLPNDRAARLRIGFAKAGDVLLTHNASVGGVAIAPDDAGDFLIGTSVTYWRCNPEAIDRKYLYYFMRSEYFQGQLQFIMKQTTRNQVSVLKQVNLWICVPPLSEQRQIVAEMDDLQSKVDELKRQQAETAAELDALLPSVLDRAFRGEL
jgi:type I restriction enzyme, S subunit